MLNIARGYQTFLWFPRTVEGKCCWLRKVWVQERRYMMATEFVTERVYTLEKPETLYSGIWL